MKSTVTALVSGTLFGAGLAIAEMTNPAKVLGFLDVAGAWDPSLAFVMGAALTISAIAYRVRAPSVPFKAKVDRRLLVGAALFGLGWGLAGFCPGPAIVALASGSAKVVVFVGSMLGGMFAYHVAIERPSQGPA